MQVSVSPEVRRLLDGAASLSIRKHKYFIGVEHLFEAIVSDPSTLPPSIAKAHLSVLRRALKAVQLRTWKGEPPEIRGEPYYTPRCASVVSETNRIAEQFRSGKPTVGHILLALLQDDCGLPSRILNRPKGGGKQLAEELRACLIGKNGKAGSANGGSATGAARASNQKGPQSSHEENVVSLESFTRDMTEEASSGRLGLAIGREKETNAMLQVLSRQQKNNVILVGEAGVGKTRIVEGLAVMAATGELDELLGKKRFIELNIASLMSGTQYRGAFEEKMMGLIRHLEEDQNTILFIDEIHMIMGAGGTDGGTMDMANLLKPALGRGKLQCIGATTLDEYNKFFRKDPAMERRFQTVDVDALSPEATREILELLLPSLREHHRVDVDPSIVDDAIVLTERYMPNRQLPDKAIDVLDQACARYRLKVLLARTRPEALENTLHPNVTGKVTAHDVRKVISQMTSVPVDELTSEDKIHLARLEERLNQRIIGQKEAVGRVVAAVKRARVGLSDPGRPDAVMLFAGPTGVGKTQLAKELAKALYKSQKSLITFDMSEYVEAHSVSRLIGAPPGYVGSDEEGQLTGAALKTPFCILVFDEIEKAHPQIFDIFLPLLDEGRLKDSKGRIVSFKNTMIIFTSNVGSKLAAENRDEDGGRALKDELLAHFRPEFINRIDEIVPFRPLTGDGIRLVIRHMIDHLRFRLKEKHIGIRMFPDAYEFLIDQGFDSKFGARELRRTIDNHITSPLSEMLLEEKFVSGDMIDIYTKGSQLQFRKGKKHGKGNAAS